jgi:Fe2+ transport system protein FeoA
MDHRESNGIPLSKVAEGQRARIIAVGGGGALRRRILEMGMTRGTELRVEKYAPLRDPLEVIVKGFHVSLRVAEASEIKVEILE